MHNQVSGMNITYMRYSFEEFLNSMVRLGLPSIELWGGAPHFYIEDLNHQKVKQTLNEVKRRNLEISFFTPEQCMYPINLAAKDEVMRERSLNYFIKCLDVCNTLEVDKMLVTAGLGYFDEDKEEGWKRSGESLKRLSEAADKQGITLALEPLSTYESNLVTDLPTLQKMLAEVNSPSLKAMVDTVPMALEKETLEQYFETFGKDLIHIHLVDTNQLHAHLAWGDGSLPLKEYLQIIKKHNYEGYLTMELIGSIYTSDPEAAMKKSFNTVEDAISVLA